LKAKLQASLRDFRIGWRLLVKEPAYSAVVVFGLAAGIAACFLLLGYVAHSFSYDRNVPERESVVRLMERWNLDAMGRTWSDACSLPARDAALASGQPVLASAVVERGLDVRAGSQVYSLSVTLVDPDFQKIFSPRVLAGDLHAALTRPDALALSRETALRLFGRADVVGQVLQSNSQAYVVAAVVADQPAATTLPFDALGGTRSAVWPEDARRPFEQSWGGTPGRVYLKLLPGADAQAVLDAVQRGLRKSPLVQRDFAEQVAALQGHDLIDHKLGALGDAYLDPDTLERSPIHGDRQAILGLAAVSLLILLLAAVNYVNLATVRTLARQREIAMRKVLGASAVTVARQFLAESVLVCLIATLLGLLLAWLVQPLFSDLVQRRFDNMFSPGALLLALAFGALLGVLAGAWPAWSALRVRANAALAGRPGTETARGLWARRCLTALQFAAAMGLTGTTLAVAWQTHYTSRLSPGFDPRPLLTFRIAGDMRNPHVRALRDEIARLPGVAGVAESDIPVTSSNNYTSLQREGGQATDINQYGVSPEFFDVYGLAPVAGRLYSPALDRIGQTDRIVIDASAARKFGFASAQDAVGKLLKGTDKEDRRMQIVGVAPDMRHRSARNGEQPSVFFLRERLRTFTVRVSRGQEMAARQAIEEVWPRYFPNETLNVVHMDSFLFQEFYEEDLRLAKLLAASSVIATLIAAFGIYVLAAYSVQRRTREIVLRKLHGAGRLAVGGMVLREFAGLVGAGALMGLPLAWLGMQRYLAGFIERAPGGVWTIAAALVVAGAVALGSTLRHTLAAVRIRPALALRE
jgi:putative ABC transport system permease protein